MHHSKIGHRWQRWVNLSHWSDVRNDGIRPVSATSRVKFAVMHNAAFPKGNVNLPPTRTPTPRFMLKHEGRRLEPNGNRVRLK
jgi:hypothetical protein